MLESNAAVAVRAKDADVVRKVAAVAEKAAAIDVRQPTMTKKKTRRALVTKAIEGHSVTRDSGSLRWLRRATS
jgi:hypothetical protein